MPEGDTIHRTAAVLRPALQGRVLQRFDAPRLSGLKPEPGRIIVSVEAQGKHLLIAFDDGLVLHTHMRMSGSWHIYRTGERWRRPTHQARVTIAVDGFVAVCFNAPVVEVYRQGDRSRHPGLGSLGPDLCRADADLTEAVNRMDRFAAPDDEIANVLLDQRIACGVGNVYKCEVLWACHLDPFAPLDQVDTELRTALISTSNRLLRANLGGHERITVSGGLAVYGRSGKPCRRCQAPIVVRKQGDQARITYWCPGCQRIPSPTTGTSPTGTSPTGTQRTDLAPPVRASTAPHPGPIPPLA